MEDDDIIKFIFKKLQESNVFEFENEELTHCIDNRRKRSDELFIFIGTEIPENLREKLVTLIESYKDAKSICCAVENFLYYKSGIKTGVLLEKELKF